MEYAFNVRVDRTTQVIDISDYIYKYTLHMQGGSTIHLVSRIKRNFNNKMLKEFASAFVAVPRTLDTPPLIRGGGYYLETPMDFGEEPNCHRNDLGLRMEYADYEGDDIHTGLFQLHSLDSDDVLYVAVTTGGIKGLYAFAFPGRDIGFKMIQKVVKADYLLKSMPIAVGKIVASNVSVCGRHFKTFPGIVARIKPNQLREHTFSSLFNVTGAGWCSVVDERDYQPLPTYVEDDGSICFFTGRDCHETKIISYCDGRKFFWARVMVRANPLYKIRRLLTDDHEIVEDGNGVVYESTNNLKRRIISFFEKFGPPTFWMVLARGFTGRSFSNWDLCGPNDYNPILALRMPIFKSPVKVVDFHQVKKITNVVPGANELGFGEGDYVDRFGYVKPGKTIAINTTAGIYCFDSGDMAAMLYTRSRYAGTLDGYLTRVQPPPEDCTMLVSDWAGEKVEMSTFPKDSSQYGPDSELKPGDRSVTEFENPAWKPGRIVPFRNFIKCPDEAYDYMINFMTDNHIHYDVPHAIHHLFEEGDFFRFHLGHGLNGGSFDCILFRVCGGLHLTPCGGGYFNIKHTYTYDQNRSLVLIKKCHSHFILQSYDTVY